MQQGKIMDTILYIYNVDTGEIFAEILGYNRQDCWNKVIEWGYHTDNCNGYSFANEGLEYADKITYHC